MNKLCGDILKMIALIMFNKKDFKLVCKKFYLSTLEIPKNINMNYNDKQHRKCIDYHNSIIKKCTEYFSIKKITISNYYLLDHLTLNNAEIENVTLDTCSKIGGIYIKNYKNTKLMCICGKDEIVGNNTVYLKEYNASLLDIYLYYAKLSNCSQLSGLKNLYIYFSKHYIDLNFKSYINLENLYLECECRCDNYIYVDINNAEYAKKIKYLYISDNLIDNIEYFIESIQSLEILEISISEEESDKINWEIDISDINKIDELKDNYDYNFNINLNLKKLRASGVFESAELKKWDTRTNIDESDYPSIINNIDIIKIKDKEYTKINPDNFCDYRDKMIGIY